MIFEFWNYLDTL